LPLLLLYIKYPPPIILAITAKFDCIIHAFRSPDKAKQIRLEANPPDFEPARFRVLERDVFR
jgi:hypothetical protein